MAWRLITIGGIMSDPFDEAEKIKYIEDQCDAAKLVIDAASEDNVLYEVISEWTKNKIVSYEMTVLARNKYLDED
jgi:hypothetical protein